MNFRKIDQEAWLAWVDGRPEFMRAGCLEKPLGEFYRYAKTGQRGFIVSYFEDGTVRMFFPAALQEYGWLDTNDNRFVFGIPLAELTPTEFREDEREKLCAFHDYALNEMAADEEE